MIKIAWFFLVFLILPCSAQAFSFSEHEEENVRQEQEQKAKVKQEVDRLLAVPCKAALKNRKIAVILGGENRRDNLDPLFMEVNDKLQRLGLRTYSQKEITAQIAQAEMDAFLNNDMDAAASAASRLKADFMLRGMINARTRVNPVIGVDEVYITIIFTLIDQSGRIISNVSATGEAYSGRDTLAAALSLVKEKSEPVVARLYHDYCCQAYESSDSGQQAETQPSVQSIEDF